MEVANASLLDEATAAAEAMTMLHRVQSKRLATRRARRSSSSPTRCFPQTIDVLRGARRAARHRARRRRSGDPPSFDDRMFGALVQTPDEAGRVHDLRRLHRARARRRRAGRGRRPIC